MVQTRSEENGLRTFHSLEGALAHAKEDRSVWKVSITLPTGEIVRLVRIPAETGDGWVYEPIVV